MADSRVAVLVLLAIISSAVIAQKCVPGDNCKLPDCRCWDDPKAPGGFDTRDIPQMIVISFDYGVNSANVEAYRKLVEGVVNPNQCKIRASFYVTHDNTDYEVAAGLFKEGHEVGGSTVGRSIPRTVEQWTGNFSVVKDRLVKAGIPAANLTGARGPDTFFGGDNQITGMTANGFQYDTTCVNLNFGSGKYFWPFTFDFVEGSPNCSSGDRVTKPFPGVWEFPAADLEFDGHTCATPSACSGYIKSPQDAYDLFYNSFSQNYNQKTRPPFLMNIDPAWPLNSDQADGTRQFLQFVGAAFEDTWIVTTQQALDWVRQPVKASEAETFGPWGC